jgi:uncharacterized OB-fold protein
MANYNKPLPVMNEETRPFWEYCRKHELRMQKCRQCGHIRYPISFVCPQCSSIEAEWTLLSGKGSIYSFTVYRVAYHEAFKGDIPYVVAIIQLDEGPRMESNIIGCRVEDVRVEMPVTVSFEKVTDQVTLPKFRPDERRQ